MVIVDLSVVLLGGETAIFMVIVEVSWDTELFEPVELSVGDGLMDY